MQQLTYNDQPVIVIAYTTREDGRYALVLLPNGSEQWVRYSDLQVVGK